MTEVKWNIQLRVVSVLALCLLATSCTSAPTDTTPAQASPGAPQYSLSVNANGDKLVKGDIVPGQRHDPGTTGQYIFPEGKQLTPPGEKCYARWEWAHSNGGEDLGQTYVEFTVAAGNATIIASSIELVDKSSPPVKGTIATCQSGSPLGGHFLMIDLDTGKAEISFSDGLEEPKRTEFGFELAPGEAERVVVIATTKNLSHEWQLDLKMIVGGVPVTRIIDNEGKPFVTRAAAPGSQTVRWNGTAWVPS